MELYINQNYVFPTNADFISFFCVDRGYVRHKAEGRRGTRLTLDDDYKNHRQTSPNSRYLYPVFPGDKRLLDRELRYTVPNPNRGGRRTKLTCAEANNARLCTTDQSPFMSCKCFPVAENTATRLLQYLSNTL